MKPFDKPVYVTRPFLPSLKEFNSELEEIWTSKQLTNNGPKHQKLEREICKTLKVPNVSLFNNGTVALILAIHCLEITGDVITTPFTFPATTHVLSWTGITPIFCDIDQISMNIDVNKIEQIITPRTTAILGVHIFGNHCDVHQIQEIASRFGLKVIYDAAHAFNTEIDGTGVGNFGDISMFSFHATKVFHTAEGGALTFKDTALKQRIDLMKNFGIINEEEIAMPGINGKMNEIQAALGLVNLRHLEEERIKRRKINDTYNGCLRDIEGISLAVPHSTVRNSNEFFVIRIDKDKFGISRDEVYNRLKTYNVHPRKYFYPLCSDYTCYKHLSSAAPNNLPVAKKVAEEVLCLPNYGDLDIPSVVKICEIIKGLKIN